MLCEHNKEGRKHLPVCLFNKIPPELHRTAGGRLGAWQLSASSQGNKIWSRTSRRRVPPAGQSGDPCAGAPEGAGARSEHAPLPLCKARGYHGGLLPLPLLNLACFDLLPVSIFFRSVKQSKVKRQTSPDWPDRCPLSLKFLCSVPPAAPLPNFRNICTCPPQHPTDKGLMDSRFCF